MVLVLHFYIIPNWSIYTSFLLVISYELPQHGLELPSLQNSLAFSAILRATIYFLYKYKINFSRPLQKVLAREYL